jgi:amidase/aspartyl-tRNA(Asn)/glutamyl-tRNA(Gln) amidotransferase subunit A
VAKGIVPVALGTDTGGSIRVPAALCGLWGYRDVPGAWMEGGYPLASEFDTLGWFTRGRAEMARMLRAWFELEPERMADQMTPKVACYAAEPIVVADVAARVRDYACGLEGDCADGNFYELATLIPVANEAFNVLQSAEAYGLHAARIERYGALYDPEVKARLLRGRGWTPADIQEARAFQKRLRAWFDRFFQEYDALVLPAVPSPALPAAQTPPGHREQTLRLTAVASLVGLPVLTVPLETSDHATIGAQVIFPPNRPELPLKLVSA